MYEDDFFEVFEAAIENKKQDIELRKNIPIPAYLVEKK
jgi:hypothetical protein